MAVHQDGRWWRNYRCAINRATGLVLDRNCALESVRSRGVREPVTISRQSAGPGVTGRVRCGNGRRPDSRVGEATGPSAHLRRCGHRTRRDPRRGCRLCFGHGVDSGPRRAARGNRCCGFNARTTRIAVQQHRPSATRDSASLRAAGGNPDLSQLAGARRASSPATSDASVTPTVAWLCSQDGTTDSAPVRRKRATRTHPGRGVGRRPWSNTPAPQSKPVAHASRLVTPPRRRWRSGLAVRITAVGSAHLRLYDHAGRLRTRTQSPLGLLRAGPVGCYGPIRLGGLPDARNASGRILCFGHSQRSKHATTGEATAWLLEV